jgi:hypothetical protein
LPRTSAKNKNILKNIEVTSQHPYDFFLMAMTTNFPPQAYTRDTLVKAIEWLSSQPPSVRERASSADLVVSFYLQACRKTAAQIEAPVSGANFTSDLKHLAEDLKQFEEPSPPQRLAVHGSHEAVEAPVHPLRRPLSPPPPAPTYFNPPEPIFKPEPPPPPPPKSIAWPVDARSQHAARELQQRLNLSSETEALRILVTLGAEHAKTLFP